MKLFGNKGRHTETGRGKGKKPKASPAGAGREKPSAAHSKSDFDRRMAENMGGTPAGKTRRSGRKSKLWMIAAVAAGCLALIAVISVAAFMIWSEPPEVSDGGLTVQTTPTPTPAEEDGIVTDPSAAPEATAEPTPDAGEVIRRPDTYTVLVVGRDRVGMNTDTIMLAMLDCAKGELNIVSIPRDTLVNVSWSVKKVNSIYGAGGTEGLLNGIEKLIGYEVDNYVIINTAAFQQAIDAIGGVYFNVPINMYYDDPGQNLHIYLQAGYQWLNGAQAEQVVRFRQNNDGTGYPNGDLGRIATQQAFLTELAKQLLSLGNISNLPTLVDIVLSNTDTNLSSGNMAFYAEEFLKLSSDSIHFYTLPYDGVSILGGSYLSIRLGDWLTMLNTSFNPYNREITQDNLDILMYSNGTTWSTTGYAQPLSSFYDYNAAARTPEPQPPAEQPPAEQPPAEQPPAEQPPAVEQPPVEQAPAVEQPPPVADAPSAPEQPAEG